MKHKHIHQILFWSSLTLALLPATAHAHERDFPFSYDWFQPAKGEKEIESHTFYTPSGNALNQELEFEYGLTDRFSIAPYISFEQGDGRALHFDAWKLEARYQLGTFHSGRVLPGLYLEYEKANGEDGELEGKLILSQYGRGGDDLTLNYIITRNLGSGMRFEHAYSVGYATTLGKSAQPVRGGVEWVHNLTDGTVNLGPVVGFTPVRPVWVVIGYAFALNHHHDNAGQLRAVAEYEWF